MNVIKMPAGSLVRVDPAQRRKIIPGENGITLLAIGGESGKAYPPASR